MFESTSPLVPFRKKQKSPLFAPVIYLENTTKNHNKQKFWSRFGIAFFSSLIIVIVASVLIRVFVLKHCESFRYKYGSFDFVFRSITLAKRFNYYANGFSLHPLKTSKNQKFSIFSGGIDRDQWKEMV